MATQEIPGPDLPICANCRSFSRNGNHESRCAGRDGAAPFGGGGSCPVFKISFAAAKQFAFRNRSVMEATQPDEPWAEDMRRHLSARASQSPMHS
jgi:hypothetical protein